MFRFAVILIVGSLLAGCASDPLRDVPRLSDTDVSDTEIQAALRGESDIRADDEITGPTEADRVEAPQPRGLFGRLFGRDAAAPDEATSSLETADTEEPVVVAAVAETEADASSEDATEPPRRGLLGFLSRAAAGARQSDAQPDDATQLAALPAEGQVDDVAAPAPSAGPARDAPDYQIVAKGTQLPYGVLARVCDLSTRELGTRVERYPDGRSTYELYDSQPGNVAPHTFYLTGFDDGCVRQFTAALAMFGSPETHEQLRYGLPSKVQPYSATDAAYETLKSRICRVGTGKPCGSSMSRLARDTAFVSVYETFGSNPEWKTILLHDGEVIETDIRGN
ncbi:MAG: hypothetical protein MRY75_16990 [Marivita sp.]|uniref:hypothetical protein n=1 Tax=Marivita sp. TaxID=2003365 RepID=UPI0025C3317D|nr:hypothetical protein [Marivita sp.]MCI5112244.1 hypothetical protein [Marivita sp.]